MVLVKGLKDGLKASLPLLVFRSCSSCRKGAL